MQANVLWQKQPKANAELFALTYGALVGELLRDLEKPALVQEELEKMGVSMGLRAMEEFLAKSSQASMPRVFGEGAAEALVVALKMFLGMSCEAKWKEQGQSFVIHFVENPFTIFVEPPEEYLDLEYNQLIAGMCRGMLEVLQLDCNASVSKSMLKGDELYELTIELNQVLQEGAGEEYGEE
jgi:trafficking protein particle complex subunit 3